MEYLYPLKLDYICKTALWGGDNLKTRFSKESSFKVISETWELSVREDNSNIITNGCLCGMKLSEYLTRFGNSVIGKDYTGDRFPLLIKFIDAQDKLSVQVHPDDAYAIENEGDLGKTEMWYIISAQPDSELIYGLKPGVCKQQFCSAYQSGKLDTVLEHKKVTAGECYFIPSGMVHAIGAGIIVAEIQQNSDVTYRVYDYDRIQDDGKPRQLHKQKAIDVIKLFEADEIEKIRYKNGADSEYLADCEYFRVKKLELNGEINDSVFKESFKSILVLSGEGIIKHANKEYSFKAGDSYYLPAGMGEYTLDGDAQIIISSIG